ncbi:hypothetical protein V6246_00350 [Algibacter sp. TI.3.09]|uniref:hypothetical protein n=1 Tax=Algibacter sp. TI.3.09 TaxID=3121298 RepID=UPI00311DD861
MKFKQILLFTLCITFFACSSESSNSDEEETTDNTLVKKIVYYDEFTETFNYDGNKLNSITDNDGYETKITYSDNKVTRIDNYEDNELLEYFTVSYNSEGKLTSYINYLFDIDGNDIAYNQILTYNNDNTVDVEVLRGNFSSQTEPMGTTTYTISNSNITKLSYDDITDNETYEFDNKKGVFNNILGFEVINFININSEFGFEIYGGSNNVTKITDEQDGWPTSSERFEYTYNENGYPKSSENYYNEDISNPNEEELLGTIEYIYE